MSFHIVYWNRYGRRWKLRRRIHWEPILLYTLHIRNVHLEYILSLRVWCRKADLNQGSYILNKLCRTKFNFKCVKFSKSFIKSDCCWIQKLLHPYFCFMYIKISIQAKVEENIEILSSCRLNMLSLDYIYQSSKRYWDSPVVLMSTKYHVVSAFCKNKNLMILKLNTVFRRYCYT